MISPYASPSEYGWHSRTFIMSKYLVSRGHKVTVFSFTGSHYLRLKRGKEIRNDSEIHEGVAFKWFNSVQFKNQTFPSRILNWWLFNKKFKNFLNSYTSEKPDAIVYSIPALHHLRIMPQTKELFPSAKHILEIRDIWPLSVQDLSKLSKGSLIVKRLKSAEKIGFEYADAVIALQPNIHAYIKTEYPNYNSKNIHFIPHAYVPEPENYFNNSNEFEIGYAGTISRANNVETLIKALHILNDRFDFRPSTLIIGAGSALKQLKSISKGLNVEFKNWMHRDKVLNELSGCKVCYDGFRDLGLYNFGFSRLKWVDYMLLKKPILAAYSGAKVDIDINEIGWQSKAEDPNALAVKLIQIFDLDNAHEIKQKGNAGFTFLKKHRHIDILGSKYEKIILD